MSEHDDLVLAEDAKQLLSNPALQKVLKDMESRLVDQLSQHDMTADKTLWLQSMLANKRDFEKRLKSAIQTGQFIIEDRKRKALRDRIGNIFR